MDQHMSKTLQKHAKNRLCILKSILIHLESLKSGKVILRKAYESGIHGDM